VPLPDPCQTVEREPPQGRFAERFASQAAMAEPSRLMAWREQPRFASRFNAGKRGKGFPGVRFSNVKAFAYHYAGSRQTSAASFATRRRCWLRFKAKSVVSTPSLYSETSRAPPNESGLTLLVTSSMPEFADRGKDARYRSRQWFVLRRVADLRSKSSRSVQH